MVSDRTRQELWNQLLDIDRMCRYYEAQHNRATRLYVGIRLVTLIAIAGAVGSILDLIPGPTTVYQVLLAIGVALVTIWEAVFNYGKKSAVAQAIYVQAARIRIELRSLWLAVNDESDESSDDRDVRKKVRTLAGLAQEIENWAGANDFATDSNLNKQTTKEAFNVVSDRYKGEPSDV